MYSLLTYLSNDTIGSIAIQVIIAVQLFERKALVFAIAKINGVALVNYGALIMCSAL